MIEPDPNFIFVLMAIQSEMNMIFEGIKEAGRSFGFHVQRIIDVPGDYKITDKILEFIERASFIIADLSYERPNVYFELGYARGIKKTIITIAKEGTNLHFDIKDWRCLFYTDSRDIEQQLKKDFEQLFPERLEIEKTKEKHQIISKDTYEKPKVKKLSLTEFILQSSATTYNDQVLVIAYYLLMDGTATFTVSMIKDEFMKARLKKPANMADVIYKLLKKGFIQEYGKLDGKTAYQITISGENRTEELIHNSMRRR